MGVSRVSNSVVPREQVIYTQCSFNFAQDDTRSMCYGSIAAYDHGSEKEGDPGSEKEDDSGSGKEDEERWEIGTRFV